MSKFSGSAQSAFYKKNVYIRMIYCLFCVKLFVKRVKTGRLWWAAGISTIFIIRFAIDCVFHIWLSFVLHSMNEKQLLGLLWNRTNTKIFIFDFLEIIFSVLGKFKCNFFFIFLLVLRNYFNKFEKGYQPILNHCSCYNNFLSILQTPISWSD